MLRSQRPEIARTDEFGQLGMRSQLTTKSAPRGDSESAAAASRNFFNRFFLFSRRRARFIFSVKRIFLAKLKIKFIFFLSLSQLISTLKPAGEDDHKACVNKL